MNPRFFCPIPLNEGDLAALPDAAAHHVAGVLRLQSGAEITLFNGEGGEFAARLDAIRPRVLARILSYRATEREPPLHITLAQVMPSGDRMDWVVQKAAELGVAALLPLMSSRSVLKLAGERAARRHSHWHLVAAGASEQCGRNRVMQVGAPATLANFLADSAARHATKLVMIPRSGSNLSGLAEPDGAVVLLVGPEGGLADDECAAALTSGFRALQLGPRVLRADTAGIAAAAAMLARWGDF